MWNNLVKHKGKKVTVYTTKTVFTGTLKDTQAGYLIIIIKQHLSRDNMFINISHIVSYIVHEASDEETNINP